MGGAKAGDVNMDLDHLQEESHSRAAAPVPPAPGIPVGSGPAPPSSPAALTRERYRRRGALHPAFASGNGFLKHPGISNLPLNLERVFFFFAIPENLKLPLFSKIRVFFKSSLLI